MEALLDLGRRILAGGFGEGVSEYRETARLLEKHGVLPKCEVALLRLMAGYRNRLVHFYHESEAEELYQICANDLGDLGLIATAYRQWLRDNPSLLDRSL